MQAAVQVSNFTKRYGDFTAVSGISFQVAPGEIFGLLGPNGAGKTSTMECLEGLRTAYQGSLSILGVDPGRESRKLRNLIGVQLQASGLPAAMTVDEAMRFFFTLIIKWRHAMICLSAWAWAKNARRSLASFPPGSSAAWR